MKREKFIRSIRKSGTSFAINIPPEIIKILKLKENDIVRVEIEKVEKK
jgi:antitoxin component of MazEF toxin-antitoxin module